MQCRYHPDREAVTVCQKMLIGYCSECMENGVTCTDPSNYCKFRPQCIIHELSKERRRANRSGSGDQSQVDTNSEAGLDDTERARLRPETAIPQTFYHGPT